MRRKPNSQGGSFNNQSRKPRYQGGGQGGHSQGGNSSQHGRPRKNYPVLREKYLGQARDALAAGDRVLAENYYQHADHCYRMMVEEGYNTRNNYTPPPGQAEGSAEHTAEGNTQQETTHQEESQPSDNHPLPAFLTAGFNPDEPAVKPAEPMAPQNWEERDA